MYLFLDMMLWVRRVAHSILFLPVLVLGCVLPASAQEVLPRPEPPFKGQICLTAKDSKPDFPQEVKAPKGAPNILVILTDDVGFAATSTLGGPIPTPGFDRLAANGLRYTRFHTTALCSPTREALLSGRTIRTQRASSWNSSPDTPATTR